MSAGTGMSPAARLLDPSDARWISYVASRDEATPFHHPAWMRLLAAAYGFDPFVYAILDESGRVRAGLPLMKVVTPLRGAKFVSLPFSDCCEPLADDPDLIERLRSSLTAWRKRSGISQIEIRSGWAPDGDVRRGERYVYHKLRLAPDLEAIAKRVDHSHLRYAKIAEEKGIAVHWSRSLADLRSFYAMHVETRRGHGVPVQPWRYFRCFHEHILDSGLGSLALARRGERCVGGLVLLHWKGTLIVKYGASRRDSLRSRPNDLLYWTAIRWAFERGYKVFDIGRSDVADAGLARFKRDWGAEETFLDYSILSDAPVVRRPSAALRAMKSVIRRSPPWVCRLLGEAFYRYVG